MENFMGAMERGITDNARAPVDALVATYHAMQRAGEQLAPPEVALAAGSARSAAAAGLNQHVTIYGGVTLSPEARPQSDPLRELYFAQLGYQQR